MDLDRLKDAALRPRVFTEAPADVDGRAELVRGAELLRLHGPRAKNRATLQGHQILVSDVLDARHDVSALLMPRRSFKTSTLFAKAMGRISSREDYFVSYTMCTLAIKARQRFRDDIVKPLEMLFPNPKDRPFKLVKAGGSERVEWLETGSVFAFLAPKGDAFRSDAWDWIILDEAGEATVEMGEDILEAAPETQDTRENPSLTMAGTGPRFREGNVLWDALEKGRAHAAGYSIVDYSAEQDLTVEQVDTWEKAERELIRIHPTYGTVSNAATIKRNFGLHGPAKFIHEYLGVAGRVGGTSFLDVVKWAKGELTGEMPKPPEEFSMAIAVHPEQAFSAIGVAWRVDGVAHVGLLDHRAGMRWLPGEAARFARKYKLPIVHDSVGQVMVEVEVLNRMRPKPRMEPQKTGDITTAAGLFVKELDAGNIRHWGQEQLDEAVRIATKRDVLKKAYAFGRPVPEDDICALEAVSMALHYFDNRKAGYVPRIVTSKETAA